MASPRYTLNINLQEPEKKRELTKKEKAKNYWHYHKWYYIFGILALIIVAFFINSITSVQHADFQIAVLTENHVPEQALTSLEQALLPYVGDVNGDGDVIVSVVLYQFTSINAESFSEQPTQNAETTQGSNNPYVQMASVTKLMADFQNADSMLFLTDDVASFQTAYEIFAYNDGSTPKDGELLDIESIGVKWQDSETLRNLPLGDFEDIDNSVYSVQDIFMPFTLALRIIDNTSLSDNEQVQKKHEQAILILEQLSS